MGTYVWPAHSPIVDYRVEQWLTHYLLNNKVVAYSCAAICTVTVFEL